MFVVDKGHDSTRCQPLGFEFGRVDVLVDSCLERFGEFLNGGAGFGLDLEHVFKERLDLLYWDRRDFRHVLLGLGFSFDLLLVDRGERSFTLCGHFKKKNSEAPDIGRSRVGTNFC